ncbi:MAG TPA: BadF/BadG/BcrA/BcrD ATPase family protein, partial [Ignavibacteriaceae bacterium]|nr:BadF/BadG/BcrA/BcrD ATPase family protein [Ignavibacteriaceae bacterium]
MKYLIGMDGGGTKTKCIITDLDINPIYETTGGPSNFLMLGNEKVAATILDLIKDCVENQKINLDDIESIVLGTTGGGRRSDAESLEISIIEAAKSKNLTLKNFRVESDARIALEGAFSGKPGSILIAGTGSIMFGKDAKGEIHRVGGFGRFLGDEGSGYRIGQRGLNAVAKDFDGRGNKTLMTELVLKQFSISSRELLITEIYRNNFDIASAAPVVLEAAEKNDKEAVKIIESESDEMILHISAMKEKLNEKTFYVSLIG